MNLDIFMTEYRVQLFKAIEENPAGYAWLAQDHFDVVLEKMKNAIIKGSYNKEGGAIKMTCKKLGIKHTYKAINAFIQETSV